MQHVVWILILVLLVLHQDNWFWEDRTLVFGFMPVGLFFHACISLAAGIVWFLAVRFCWPHELDEPLPADTPGSGDEGRPDGGGP